MPSQVTNYKCPACTGPLHFVGTSGKLECDYCGSKYDVAEIEALYAEKDAQAAKAQEAADQKREEAKEKAAASGEGWDTTSAGGEWGAEADGMRSYSCPSCGAELICDETTAATSCPYCGNPTVVPGQFGGTKRPDYVLPFKLDKKAAVAALKEHYKGKILLPRAFTAENHVEEIKGVYVPFWLFDAQADASIRYEATRSHSHMEGDYRVTNTEHYDVYRSGTIDFERVPVDGSSKMPDDYMDSIEPFNYEELKDFSTAYLPGFLADKYDVDANAASPRADERCEHSAEQSVRNTVVGYESVIAVSKNINLNRGQVKYALMPVWMLSTKWKDKTYLFAMNGQTGKIVGDLPVDKGKLRKWFWGLGLGLSVIFSLLFSGPLGRMIMGFLS